MAHIYMGSYEQTIGESRFLLQAMIRERLTPGFRYQVFFSSVYFVSVRNSSMPML